MGMNSSFGGSSRQMGVGQSNPFQPQQSPFQSAFGGSMGVNQPMGALPQDRGGFQANSSPMPSQAQAFQPDPGYGAPVDPRREGYQQVLQPREMPGREGGLPFQVQPREQPYREGQGLFGPIFRGPGQRGY